MKIFLKVEMDRKDKNGNVVQKGGVVIDKMQDVLGYVYEGSRYNIDGTRKIENNKGILSPKFVESL